MVIVLSCVVSPRYLWSERIRKYLQAIPVIQWARKFLIQLRLVWINQGRSMQPLVQYDPVGCCLRKMCTQLTISSGTVSTLGIYHPSWVPPSDSRGLQSWIVLIWWCLVWELLLRECGRISPKDQDWSEIWWRKIWVWEINFPRLWQYMTKALVHIYKWDSTHRPKPSKH